MPVPLVTQAEADRSTRQVLMVEGGSLLDDVVRSILSGQGDLQVATIASSDEAAIMQQMHAGRPDVVLLNDADAPGIVRTCALLMPPGAPAMRLIVVRSDSPVIDVYEKQRFVATQTADLVALIRRGEDGV